MMVLCVCKFYPTEMQRVHQTAIAHRACRPPAGRERRYTPRTMAQAEPTKYDVEVVHDWKRKDDANWPHFHVQPRSGWVNDPNGPLTHGGLHHMMLGVYLITHLRFYQHIPDKAHWDWGMKWGHCVSSDMVHWRHLGVALSPTKLKSDSCGCWSGCVTVDHCGQPSALYTGVRLKGTAYDGPEQKDYAPGEPMVEAVLLSRCFTTDGDLEDWSSGHVVLESPPDFGCPLEGWRDPFLFSGGKQGERLQMVMAAGKCCDGVADGCVLLYSAERLEGPWSYDGILFQGDYRAGRVAECPGLVQIYQKGVGTAPKVNPAVTRQATTTRTTFVQTTSQREDHVGKHLLAFGCYESTKQNEGWLWDPNIYYIGDFDGKKFHPDCAPGNIPRRLDIGDAPYAPNFQIDVHGRLFVWVWLRDPRPDTAPEAQYCGCLGLPRLMSYLPPCPKSLEGDCLLFQEPLPELDELRVANLWSCARDSAQVVRGNELIPGACGVHWEGAVTLQRQGAHQSCLLVATSEMEGVLFAIDWDKDEFTWIKGEEEALLSSQTLEHAKAAGSRNQTGPLGLLEARAAGVAVAGTCVASIEDEISVRVFVDGSTIETFTGTGQVASTRMYTTLKGSRQLHAVSFGGDTAIHGDVWEMGTIWRDPEGVPTDPALAA